MSSKTRHKMYKYEVSPPASVWERIVVDLDASDLSQDYPGKLYAQEIMPPATAWARIAASLDANSPQKNRSSLVPLFRYAAAAAIIAALVWVGSMVMNREKTGSPEVARVETPKQQTQPVNNTPSAITKKDPEKNIEPTITEEARNDAALEQSKKTYARLNVPTRSKIRNTTGFHFSLDQVEPLSAEDADPATRYIVLMTPDGNFIRMSKKLSDLVCCVSGEEQDQDCVDQLKKWRNKMATSAAYSPGNFGDLMDLVKSLQE